MPRDEARANRRENRVAGLWTALGL